MNKYPTAMPEMPRYSDTRMAESITQWLAFANTTKETAKITSVSQTNLVHRLPMGGRKSLRHPGNNNVRRREKNLSNIARIAGRQLPRRRENMPKPAQLFRRATPGLTPHAELVHAPTRFSQEALGILNRRARRLLAR
jgi:hypothetical protein